MYRGIDLAMHNKTIQFNLNIIQLLLFVSRTKLRNVIKNTMKLHLKKL